MKITERGQITIPKNLRHKYGLDQYVEIAVIEQGNQLVIVKAPAMQTPLDRVYGILKGLESQESTDEYIKALRGSE